MAISRSFKEIDDAGSISALITPVLAAPKSAINHHFAEAGSIFQPANFDHRVIEVVRKIRTECEDVSNAGNRMHNWPRDAGFLISLTLEALRGDKTVQECAAKHKVHPTQATTWKRQAIDGLTGVFSDKAKKAEDNEANVKQTEEVINSSQEAWKMTPA